MHQRFRPVEEKFRKGAAEEPFLFQAYINKASDGFSISFL
jgi:hypothetical protein